MIGRSKGAAPVSRDTPKAGGSGEPFRGPPAHHWSGWPGRTIWPTRDGWWCLAGTIGLGFAAMTSGNNLLYLLVAMLLGLLTDIMSGGPLGFWALLTLIGASAGGYAKVFGAGREVVTLWLFWACLAAGLALFGCLLASVFFLRWVDWWPIAVGAAASVVLFPVVVKGLRWIERGSFALGARANYRGRA